uniref:ATP synthase complex subunit 8 n=1 Tax=Leucophoroptera quadrimaculata TaxID=981277 RepID=A0A514LQK4_9HEMI|nr:ATP synthase F0 subunit 8 [Leucophoroptera quadrimaculata]
MPQMSPMWWSTLFIMFITTYMLVMVLMYFFNMYKLKTYKKKLNKKHNNINWKW